MMLKVFAVCTVLACFAAVDALKCRSCNKAATIDDCITSVECLPDELCYMEERVTEQLTLEYEAGCRSKAVCKSANGGNIAFGRKKRDLSVIACSRCCSGFDDCNTKMCGIPPSDPNTSQCYLCDSDKEGGQGSVRNASDCLTLQTCQDDEMCYTAVTATGNSETYRFGCYPKRICQFLTRKILEDTDKCLKSNGDPLICGDDLVRRSDATCHVCCGDAACNTGTCVQVKDRLYKLWTAGVLDMSTLKTNATAAALLTTTPATKTTTASSSTTKTSTIKSTPSPTTASTPSSTPSTTASSTTASTASSTASSTTASTPSSTASSTTASTPSSTTASTPSSTASSTTSSTPSSTTASTPSSTASSTTSSTPSSTTASTGSSTVSSTTASTQSSTVSSTASSTASSTPSSTATSPTTSSSTTPGKVNIAVTPGP